MTSSTAAPDAVGQGKDCWPASFRDWLSAQCVVRAGRFNSFSWVREVRHRLCVSVSKHRQLVEFETPYQFSMLLPVNYNGLILMALCGRLFHPRLTEILGANVRPGDTVIDGGGHLGFFTLLAGRRLNGKGRVITFEPTPDTFSILQENVVRNGLQGVVQLEQKALTNTSGIFSFLEAGESMLNHLTVADEPTSGVIRVEGVNLDSYLAAKGLGRVDVIKLDLEGAEHLALQGMTSSLRAARLLVFEMNEPRLLEMQTDPLELIDETARAGAFTSLSYIDERTERLCDWDPQEFLHLLREYKFVNVICQKQTRMI